MFSIKQPKGFLPKKCQ